MKYIIMFLVLASITSCIARDPAKYKYISVTLDEIIEETRWINHEKTVQTWYKYVSKNQEPCFLLIPLDNDKRIGSVHLMYVRQ